MAFALYWPVLGRRGKILICLLLFVVVLGTQLRLAGRRPVKSSLNRATSSSPAKVKQRVAMVTASDFNWYWQGAPEAFKLAVQERQEYAALHGYHFDMIDLRSFKEDSMDSSWPVVWHKIPVVKFIFKKYPDADWVWWLDADAIIMGKQDLDTYLFDPIESRQAEARQIQRDLQDEHHKMGIFDYAHNITLEETNLIVTPDMAAPWINAGSFLIRRREIWTEMLFDFWTDPFFFKAAKDNTVGHQEQGVLSHLIVQHETVARHTAVVPMTTINAFPYNGPWTWQAGSLVMHTAGCWVSHKCEHWIKEYRAVKNGLKEHVDQDNWTQDKAYVNED